MNQGRPKLLYSEWAWNREVSILWRGNGSSYPNMSVKVGCHVQMFSPHDNSALIFEPNFNPHWIEGLPTTHVKVLAPRPVIGTVQNIQSLYPASILDGARPPSQVSLSHVQVKKKPKATNQMDPPVSLSHLCELQRDIVHQMLSKESALFSKTDDDFGCTEKLQLSISLKDTESVARTYLSVPKPDHIVQGWVQKSNSPYASFVICVWKNDGSLWLCIDFCEVNRKTLPDQQPIHWVQETMDRLGANSCFSLLDQEKTYHQTFMAKENRLVTSFFTPWGLYEWIWIPWSLMNAAVAFQCCIEGFLEGLRDEICITYLEDTVVFSRSSQDHVSDVRAVLQQHGFKLKLSFKLKLRALIQY